MLSMKNTLSGMEFSTSYKRGFSDLRLMRTLLFLLVFVGGTAAGQETRLFCAQLIAEGEPAALLEAQDGLFSTVGDFGPGSSYFFEVSAFASGEYYLITEDSNGRIKVSRAKEVKVPDERMMLRLPGTDQCVVDDSGNRDEVAVFFSATPQKRRMLKRSLRRASGNFTNKVRSTLLNEGVTFAYEGCITVKMDAEITEASAVMIVSIDKK